MRSFLSSSCNRALCGFAAGQSLLVSQGQILQFSGPANTVIGDPVPRLHQRRSVRRQAGPDNAVIGDNGKVFFRAQILQSTGAVYPAASGHLARGLLLRRHPRKPGQDRGGGDPEPSGTIAGAVLNTSFNSAAIGSGSPRISASGHHDVRRQRLGHGRERSRRPTTPSSTSARPAASPSWRARATRPRAAAARTTRRASAAWASSPRASTRRARCSSSRRSAPRRSPRTTRPGSPAPSATSSSCSARAGLFRAATARLVNTLGFVSQMNSAGWVVTDLTLVVGSGTRGDRGRQRVPLAVSAGPRPHAAPARRRRDARSRTRPTTSPATAGSWARAPARSTTRASSSSTPTSGRGCDRGRRRSRGHQGVACRPVGRHAPQRSGSGRRGRVLEHREQREHRVTTTPAASPSSAAWPAP